MFCNNAGNPVSFPSRLKRLPTAISTVKALENAIKILPAPELAKFRKWFAEFDAAAWDAQIESDAAADRLEALAREAITEYWGGTAREI